MSLFTKLFGPNSNAHEDLKVEAPELLVIVPIPPLVEILALHERQKGAPLTEAEVMDIAAGAICMTMSQSRAAAMAEARGYADINPDRAWEEWNLLRSES